MSIKCRKCECEFNVLGNVEVIQAGEANEDLVDSLDMIIECPHCGTRYNSFLDVRDDFENWVEL